MWQKLYIVAVGLFFVSMNILLLRSVVGDKDAGTSVPIESVQRRLLESADDSNLQILHHDTKVGFCRWSASLVAFSPDPTVDTSSLPEGMVQSIRGYHLDFDGSLTGEGFDKLRFNFTLNLDTNYVWTRMHVRLRALDSQWDVSSVALDKSLQVSVLEGPDRRKREFSFSDLSNPAAILAAFGGAHWGHALAGISLPWSRLNSGSATFGLTWQARTARRKIGHTQVPVYRLEAPLFDEYKIVVTLLESGEILRVDLPDEWSLVNEDLLNM